jgi:hypothetical protein
MRYTGLTASGLVASGLAAIIGLTGCTGASGAHQLTPSASAAASAVLGEAQGCLQSGSFLTHSGRVKIKLCVGNLVPAANRTAAIVCTVEALATHHTHNSRENAVAACLRKNGAVPK